MNPSDLPEPNKNHDEIAPVDDISSSLPESPATAPAIGQLDSSAETKTTDDSPVPADQLVDEIIAEEKTDLLLKDDEVELAKKPKKTGFKQHLKNWWSNKKLRYLTLGGILLLIGAVVGLPVTRYFILNTFGVRASASLTVHDNKTDQPLKNVEVTIGDQTTKTDENGKAKLTKLRLGTSKLVISKRSFADKTQNVTIGWGSNPFATFGLTPTGSRYSFKVVDWLSQKPIEKAEISYGENSAVSDKDGKVVLTTDPGDNQKLTVVLSAKTYRSEKIDIQAATKDTSTAKLVTATPHFFASKRDGTYTLYQIDADGKNEKLILTGTGKERDDLVLSPSPDRKQLIYVSTRAGTLNSDGYALQNMYQIEVATKKITSIDTSEQIRIIGWIGSKVVYIKVVAGASGANPNRQKLLAYDVNENESTELASNNNFNDVAIIGDQIYYAPGDIYGDTPDASLYAIRADKTAKKTLLGKEVWSFIRTSYSQVAISTANNTWFGYTVGDSEAKSMTTPTVTPHDRQYIDSADGNHSAWYDYRDGKGVLLVWDKDKKVDTIIVAKGGLSVPFTWLDSRHIVYRIQTNQEVADYVVSIDGGEPQKIADVSYTSTTSGANYY